MKLIICVLGLCALAAAQDNFKECLDKDSISCVQMMVRKEAFWITQSEADSAGHLKVKQTRTSTKLDYKVFGKNTKKKLLRK